MASLAVDEECMSLLKSGAPSINESVGYVSLSGTLALLFLLCLLHWLCSFTRVKQTF